MPIFSITPASTTEPAVGASVCASGSHVWNGNSGTFTANADREREEQPLARRRVETFACADAHAVSVRTSKVRMAGRVLVQERDATACPTNRNAEPAIVNRKNFVAA